MRKFLRVEVTDHVTSIFLRAAFHEFYLPNTLPYAKGVFCGMIDISNKVFKNETSYRPYHFKFLQDCGTQIYPIFEYFLSSEGCWLFVW